LRDAEKSESITCSSYREAISTVKEREQSSTATKIEDRDGEIVFTSDSMDIDDWEREWKNAKRSLSAEVESHECPYDSKSCIEDDLCVQCRMDKIQETF
jgi:hypothetical protein